MACRYIHYLFRAKTKHGVHSPFVFNLLKNVINDKKFYSAYEPVEKLRSELLNERSEIKVNDFGAGSAVFKNSFRKIKDIAKYSLKSAKYGQLIFRLVNYFQPSTILELGTSLGVTTLYLAIHTNRPNVLSMEGSEVLALKAMENFEKLNISNIEVVTGNFDDMLAPQLKKLKGVDFVFVDGNHRKEPTLRYFEECLQYSDTNSIFVLDDIHWSDEMEGAWEFIKNHERVTVTVDLFFLGLVFFRKEQAKQNFVLMY